MAQARRNQERGKGRLAVALLTHAAAALSGAGGLNASPLVAERWTWWTRAHDGAHFAFIQPRGPHQPPPAMGRSVDGNNDDEMDRTNAGTALPLAVEQQLITLFVQ